MRRALLVAVLAVLVFVVGAAGMAVLVMWALLWPLQVLARVVGAS